MSMISAHDPYPRQRMTILDSQMAYVDEGTGQAVVFLHGNPTSSYLWRNVIPHVTPVARCLAPDLIGMGQSGPSAGGSYRFVDHARYLDAWLEATLPRKQMVFVGHDWGGALAFDWAATHPDRVAGLVYLETIVRPLAWNEWPEGARKIFQAMRSPVGEEIVLQKNVFIERILPSSILRKLSDEEMNVYRQPYVAGRELRRPMLTWPRQIPLDGEPADVTGIAQRYARWLSQCTVPKLFINVEPGAILVGAQREFCRTWLNQQEVTVRGEHFAQEDSPDDIGRAIASFLQR